MAKAAPPFAKRNSMPDLGSPSDVSAPMDNTADTTAPPDMDEGSGDITLTISRDQASALKDLISQIDEQMGDSGSDMGTDTDMDANYPLAGGAPPMRGRGGYGS